MPQDEHLQQVVIEQLKLIRRTGIAKADELNQDGSQRYPTPNLDEAATKVPDYSERLTRSAAIKGLLEHEILLISTDPCREWLPASFGLTDETRGKAPGECQKVAARIANHTSAVDFGRTNGRQNKGLGVLAAQIVADCLTSVTTEEEAPAEAAPSSIVSYGDEWEPETSADYVHRPAIEAKLRESVNKSRVVCLVGEGGVGKTTLVKEFIKSAPPEKRLVLDAQDKDSLLFDTIVRLDIDETSDDKTIKARLRRLLGDKTHAPSFVVLDDLRDSRLARQILPSQPQSTVLVTARQEFAQTNWSYIEVGSLARDEVVEMVQRQIPNASREEIHEFSCLQGRVLAIEQVCALLRDQSPPERLAFLKTLKQHLIRTLDMAAGELETASLTAIYRDAVGLMGNRREMSQVLDLLKYVTFAVDGKFASVYANCMAGKASRAEGKVLCASASRVLQRLKLIHVYEANGEIEMHEVTRSILRNVLDDQLPEACERLIEAGEQAFAATFPPVRAITYPVTKEQVERTRAQSDISYLLWEVAGLAYDRTGDAQFAKVRQRYEAEAQRGSTYRMLTKYRAKEVIRVMAEMAADPRRGFSENNPLRKAFLSEED